MSRRLPITGGVVVIIVIAAVGGAATASTALPRGHTYRACSSIGLTAGGAWLQHLAQLPDVLGLPV